MIRNPRAITASSFAAMFFLGVGYSIIGAAARNLGLTPEQIGILLAVQNVGFGVSVAVSGALADTHSKPRILAVGSVITALAFFAFFTTQVFWINALVMVLVGVGHRHLRGRGGRDAVRPARAAGRDLRQRQPPLRDGWVRADRALPDLSLARVADARSCRPALAVAVLAVIFAVRADEAGAAQVKTTFSEKMARHRPQPPDPDPLPRHHSVGRASKPQRSACSAPISRTCATLRRWRPNSASSSCTRA